MKWIKRWMRRRVMLETNMEFSKTELRVVLAGQGGSQVVRAICQVIQMEAMERVNRSLDHEFLSERATLHEGGAAEGLMTAIATLSEMMTVTGKRTEDRGRGSEGGEDEE